MKNWRFIDSGPGSGTWNLALDEALFRLVRAGMSPPTVRWYAWSRPAISLGYAQDYDSTVDPAACRARGIGVVRRITGGRAVLHDAEVTYSVTSGPDPDLFGSGLRDTYRRIAEALATGLRGLGLGEAALIAAGRGGEKERHPSCFATNARFELSAGGKKLVGSAQRREGGSFLQQGSILLAGHGETLRSLLRERWRTLPGEGMAGLGDFLRPCPSYAGVVAAMTAGFEAAWGVGIGRDDPTTEELDLAADLERTKYRAEAWNVRRR